MQLKTLIALALASSGASVTASRAVALQDAAAYAQDFAPGEAARIQAFNASHAATLTSAQSSFLKDALAAIAAPLVADIPGLELACGALFGEGECAEILAGKKQPAAGMAARRTTGISTNTSTSTSANHYSAARRGGAVLGRRAGPACECSDGSDWCGTGFQCARPGDEDGVDCSPQGGCGTFLMYQCNGLCVQI